MKKENHLMKVLKKLPMKALKNNNLLENNQLFLNKILGKQTYYIKKFLEQHYILVMLM